MSAKFLRYAFAAALLIASPSFAQQLPAQAQMQLQQQGQPPLAAQPAPDLMACASDFQCTVVDACGDKAINRSYAASFSAVSTNIKCKKKKIFHSNAVAKCLNKRCIVIEPGQ